MNTQEENKKPLSVANSAGSHPAKQYTWNALPQDEAKRVQYQLKRSNRPRFELSIDRYEYAVQLAESVHNPDRYALYDLYTEAMRDEHLLAQVRIWREKVLSEPFVMVQKGGEIGARFVEDSRDLLHRQWFYHFLRLAMDSVLWGHSLIEFPDKRTEAGEFREVCLVWRDHVRPEYRDIVLMRGATQGIRFDEPPFSDVLVEVGDRYDLGLLLTLTRAVIKKRFSQTDWLRRNEKYGMPFLVIMTESDDEVELAKKEDMAANFGSNAYAILDDTDQIKLTESNQAFAYQTYRDFVRLIDEYISKLVNGAVLGEVSDGGSRSKEEVGERTMDTITEATMRYLSFVVNDKLLPFLRMWGYAIPEDQYFAFYATTEEGEQEAREQRMGGAANEVDLNTGQEREENELRYRVKKKFRLI